MYMAASGGASGKGEARGQAPRDVGDESSTGVLFHEEVEAAEGVHAWIDMGGGAWAGGAGGGGDDYVHRPTLHACPEAEVRAPRGVAHSPFGHQHQRSAVEGCDEVQRGAGPGRFEDVACTSAGGEQLAQQLAP